MRRMIMIGLTILATGAEATPAMPGWLSGCWSEQKGAVWTEECWTPPRGGNMLGSGRNGHGDEIRSWEAMQIERSLDDKLVFYGSPRGAPRVAFPEASAGSRDIVFANPRHDYPQRIHYWRDGMDLLAEISLIDGSKAVRWHYKWQLES